MTSIILITSILTSSILNTSILTTYILITIIVTTNILQIWGHSAHLGILTRQSETTSMLEAVVLAQQVPEVPAASTSCTSSKFSFRLACSKSKQVWRADEKGLISSNSSSRRNVRRSSVGAAAVSCPLPTACPSWVKVGRRPNSTQHSLGSGGVRRAAAAQPWSRSTTTTCTRGPRRTLS